MLLYGRWCVAPHLLHPVTLAYLPPVPPLLQSRRREQERLERLDEDWDVMKASEDFQRKQEALQREDEERTAKRRAQRQKKKVGCSGMQLDGGCAGSLCSAD
jgi:hypothetical protein